MRSTLDLLSHHAAVHRDRRHIATHMVAVPLLVLAVGVLLGRPSFELAGVVLSPAWLAFAALAGWYLRRDLVLGGATSAAIGVLLLLATALAGIGVMTWLAWGMGLLVLGALLESVGRYYEGRRPSYFDNRIGFLVAPMFVTAEAMFQFGWNRKLLEAIESRVGPPVLRDLAHPA